MRIGAVSRVDPSIVVSFTAAVLLLSALGASESVVKAGHLLVQVIWLYVSNTRG